MSCGEMLFHHIGHVTNFEILGPIYIFGMAEGRSFVFGARIDYDMY